jgi:hypothetical protein
MECQVIGESFGAFKFAAADHWISILQICARMLLEALDPGDRGVATIP